jgi:hypothetical protein
MSPYGAPAYLGKAQDYVAVALAGAAQGPEARQDGGRHARVGKAMTSAPSLRSQRA